MRRKRIDGTMVRLIPATEDSLTIGIQPGPDGGIAVALTVETATLGGFVIPLSAAQVAVLSVVGKRLLSLDEQQATQLRAELVRAIEEEGNTHE